MPIDPNAKFRRIVDRQSAAWLVEQIADETGTKPWVVVSTAAGESEPRFDFEHIQQELSGVAEIALVIDGDASWELSRLLIDYEDVYGGAARVYPAGYTPENPLKPRPIRLFQRGQRGEKETERLITDALTLAHEAGVFDSRKQFGTRTTATVKSILGDEIGIVEIKGVLASLSDATTYPGIPLPWLYVKGQELEGTHVESDGRFLIDTDAMDDRALLDAYPYGTVTLGFVGDVSRQAATIRIHPGHAFTVSKDEVSSNPRDRVDLLLAPGEVVPVRLYRDPQGRTRLRLDDIDDDEPIAPSLDFGAGPWLIEGRERVADIDDEPAEIPPIDAVELPVIEGEHADSLTTASIPRPGPGVVHVEPRTPAAPIPEAPQGRSALESMENQLHSARGQLKHALHRLQVLGGDKAEMLYNQVREERNQAITEANRLRAELADLKSDMAELRKTMREGRSNQGGSNPFDRRTRFSSPEQWLREEVRRTWISLYTPQEREKWILEGVSWEIGERFIQSLDGLKASQMRRLAKLLVHLITGRNGEEQLVEVHPLREGDEVSKPPVTRADGATCMRAYVEEGLPQSHRLHYWKLPEGSLELSRVVKHDDMEP